MKKNSLNLVLSVLAFLFLSTSCNKEKDSEGLTDGALQSKAIVIESLTAISNEEVYYVGDNITFSLEVSSKGGQPASYTWDFGDGETSSERRVTHIYKKPGDYEAKVTLTNDAGSVSKSIKLAVKIKKKYVPIIRSMRLVKMSGQYKDDEGKVGPWPNTTGENIVTPLISILDGEGSLLWTVDYFDHENIDVTKDFPIDYTHDNIFGKEEFKGLKGELPQTGGIVIQVFHATRIDGKLKLFNSTPQGRLLDLSLDEEYIKDFMESDKFNQKYIKSWGDTEIEILLNKEEVKEGEEEKPTPEQP